MSRAGTDPDNHGHPARSRLNRAGSGRLPSGHKGIEFAAHGLLHRLALRDLEAQSATVQDKPAPLNGSAASAHIAQLCAHRGDGATPHPAAPNA